MKRINPVWALLVVVLLSNLVLISLFIRALRALPATASQRTLVDVVCPGQASR